MFQQLIAPLPTSEVKTALLERFADDAFEKGRIKLEERDEWKKTPGDLAKLCDFYFIEDHKYQTKF